MAKPTQADFNGQHDGPVLYADGKGAGRFLVVRPDYGKVQAAELINAWLDERPLTATGHRSRRFIGDDIQDYSVAYRKNPDDNHMGFCVVLDGGGMYHGKGVRL